MTENKDSYKAGWNARLEDAAQKLPRYSKKTAPFHEGFNDCDTACMKAISEAIKQSRNPVYPSAL